MVEVIDETGAIADDRRDLLAAAVGALAVDAVGSHRTVTVVLVGDEAMRSRNRQDRGVDDVTDVLSYPTHEPDDVGMPQIEHLGDLFVCVPQAARQADDHGHAAFDELATLCAHGLMHLLGHDHPDEASWEPFHLAQRSIVAWIHENAAA